MGFLITDHMVSTHRRVKDEVIKKPISVICYSLVIKFQKR